MSVARWIVSRFAPAEWRESIVGDLNEEMLRRRHSHRYTGWLWSVPLAIATVRALRYEARRGVVAHTGRRLSDGMWQDVRMSVRSLRSTPGFTTIAILVLALGIGASTAIYSLVDAVLLRPLPFDQPDRLLRVGEVGKADPKLSWSAGVMTGQNYLDWIQMQTVFESIGASKNASGFTVRDSGEPEDLSAIRATSSLFTVLRVKPQRGQLFTIENEVDGSDRVLLVSDGLWRRRFNADPEIVGKTLAFDAGTWRIIGVLPSGFAYPPDALKPVDIVVPWVPSVRERTRNRQQTGRNYNLRVLGRLREGMTVEQARAEMGRIHSSLAAQYPDWFEDMTWAAVPFHDSVVGRTRKWMVMLLGAVACVLLIACANVANLLLVRSTNRSREMIVRSALGASRWRIARGLLIESVVLSMAGLVVALLLALWGASVLRASIPGSLPRVATVGLDLRVLSVAAIATFVTGLVCGLIPALQLSRPNLQAALKEGGRSGTPGRSRQKVRSGLVIAEVALAVILVVGAGLFLSSFARLMTVDLGIDYRNVLATGVNPRLVNLTEAALDQARTRSVTTVQEVLARVRALPGVTQAAAVSSGSPLSGSYRTDVLKVVGGQEFSKEDEPQIQEVSPEYFDVVRQPLRLGRVIDSRDAAGAQLVAVINDEARARYFGGADPIGQRISIGRIERVIVGVVGNVRLVGPEQAVAPGVYLASAQTPTIGATILARVNDPTGTVAAAIRQAVLASIPDVPVYQKSMEESLRALTELRRFNRLRVGAFGVLAIMIASVGIYGVMAYTVAQQTQEIGVRMALGALPQRVLAMVLKKASLVMLTGMLVGMAGAWMAAGLVEGFLFSVKPHDPIVFSGAAAVLLLTGLLAAFVPAIRAARVDPIVALRSD